MSRWADLYESEQVIQEFVGEYKFLSNFYPSPIVIDGKMYPTVEHAYQAAKAIHECEREFIRCASSPGEAKKFGRMVPCRAIRNRWDLWEKSRLAIWFAENYDITHADDMSSIIILSLQRVLNKGEIGLDKQVTAIKEYWKCQRTEEERDESRILETINEEGN